MTGAAHLMAPADGLLAGLAHPLGGWDHLLTMVLVGVVAARLGGRAVWWVPGLFVGALVVGALLGLVGQALPLAGWVVPASGLLLIPAAARARDLLWPLIALAVVAFGCYHGHAHGSEAPVAAAPLTFTAGFVAASMALHVAGLYAGWLWDARRPGSARP